ncbi:MAG: CBS domain-containing protein [Myxococcales bacterium]|nr:CBS domain-containing protein [Myxococcales bacterium]
MNCPFCGFENLPGADHCESCGHGLANIDPPSAASCALETAIQSAKLTDVGIVGPLVVSPDDTVAKAVNIMRRRRRGSVCVVVGGKLAGIFTEHDLIHRIEPGADLATIVMKDVMTPSPYGYATESTVAYALNGMAIWENRHLPIVSPEGMLLGSVSVREILRFLKKRAEV